jgi:hypothetical protein
MIFVIDFPSLTFVDVGGGGGGGGGVGVGGGVGGVRGDVSCTSLPVRLREQLRPFELYTLGELGQHTFALGTLSVHLPA